MIGTMKVQVFSKEEASEYEELGGIGFVLPFVSMVCSIGGRALYCSQSISMLHSSRFINTIHG